MRKVRLEDLNNFTEWEFPKLYDFLDFPERTRCHTYAVNRNWQVYSDILPTGTVPCARLRQLLKLHPTVLAEEMLQEELFFLKLKDEGKWTDATKYPFVHDTNPYVRMPYEKLPLEPQSFRITHDGGIKDVIKLTKEYKKKKKKKKRKGK